MYADRARERSNLAQAGLPQAPPPHGQFALDHAVLSAWEGRLTAMDESGLLRGREVHLARLLALLEEKKLIGPDLSLFECGARQDGYRGRGSIYHGGIALFMAVYAGQLNLRYRAFEPRLNCDHLLFELEHAGLSAERREELLRKVARDAVPDFSGLQKEVEADIKAGRQVVVFSNHVLNDPDLRRDIPFWKLPGLHVHAAAYVEICRCWLGDLFEPRFKECRAEAQARAEERGEEFYLELDDEDWIWERVCAEAQHINPLGHLESLGQLLGLENTSIECNYSAGRDVMLYLWQRQVREDRAPQSLAD